MVSVLDNATGYSFDTLNMATSGTSESYERRGGQFYLQVVSGGEWHIWVTPGP